MMIKTQKCLGLAVMVHNFLAHLAFISFFNREKKMGEFFSPLRGAVFN